MYWALRISNFIRRAHEVSSHRPPGGLLGPQIVLLLFGLDHSVGVGSPKSKFYLGFGN